MTTLLFWISILSYILTGIFIYLFIDSIFFGVKIWHTIIIILLWPIIIIIGIIYLFLLIIPLLIVKLKQLKK